MNNFNFFLILLCLLTIQCSKETNKPNEVETLLCKRLNAEKVVISYNQENNIIDGTSTHENYLLIEMYNPKVILDVIYNERVTNLVCDELKDFILDSIKFSPGFYFEDLKFEIIEERRFLFFKSKKPTIISYKVYKSY